MGFERIEMPKREFDFGSVLPKRLDPPELAFEVSGQAVFKSLALGLLGVTRMWSDETADPLRAAASDAGVPGSGPWTADVAHRFLSAVGRFPAPSHVVVEVLADKTTLLLRAVSSEAPKARVIRYSNSQARMSLLGPLRRSGITIPEGMMLEVPARLVEVQDGLALSVPLAEGRLRKKSTKSRKKGKSGDGSGTKSA